MSIRNPDMSVYSNQLEDADVVADEANDSFSVIDRHSIFDGTFQSKRDLRIEGEVKGTIECRGTLFVAQGATVAATVEADNIAVAGDLNGEIKCSGRLQLMPSGRVRGKVTTQTLVINEGAYYEGQLEMAKPEQRNGGQQPPRQLQPVASPAQPAATTASRPNQSNEAGASNTFIRRLGGPETPWENKESSGDQGDEASAEE
jgi:cytoskeletal protein CcmA (bactofilin family)